MPQSVLPARASRRARCAAVERRARCQIVGVNLAAALDDDVVAALRHRDQLLDALGVPQDIAAGTR